MKLISKLLIFTLILSAFTGCKKDEENLPIAGVSGTYKGELVVTIQGLDNDTLQNVSVTMVYTSGDSVLVTFPAGSILDMPIPVSANCKVTSDEDKYSLSTTKTLSIPTIGTILVSVINTSSINKSGKVVINMTATVTPEAQSVLDDAPPISIKFEGQKQ
jgi:hypothetical protein